MRPVCRLMVAAVRAAARWAGTYLMSDETLPPTLNAAYGVNGDGPAVASMLCAVGCLRDVLAQQEEHCMTCRASLCECFCIHPYLFVEEDLL